MGINRLTPYYKTTCKTACKTTCKTTCKTALSTLKDNKGITLTQIGVGILVIIILIAILAGGGKGIMGKVKDTSLEADIETLLARCLDYKYNTGNYPVMEETISDMARIDHRYGIFVDIMTERTLTTEEIDDRFKIIDMVLLEHDKYKVKLNNPDIPFILDVYDVAVIPLNEEAIRQIPVSDFSEGNIEEILKSKGIINIETDNKKMDELICSLIRGNRVIMGGKGTLKLVEFSQGNSGYTIKDITDKLPTKHEILQVDRITNVGTHYEVVYRVNDNGEVKTQTVTLN